MESIEIVSPNPSAPEGHDEAMIAAIDKANAGPVGDNITTPAETLERPEGLPEGFDSWDQLAKAYADLKAPAPETPAATAEPEPSTATPDEASKALESKGLDLDEFSQEFDRTGALSPESYDRLAKAGYPRGVVDQYVAGQQALADQHISAIKGEAGGADEYASLVTWAKANLAPAQIEAFNTAVNGSLEQAKLAVNGLNAQYRSAIGSEPNLIGGGKAAAADIFESTSQVTEAMSDKRYRSDPAYRARVQAKLLRSNVF
ncbi:capsid assembly protein [Pseudomonas mosselii]|uniref:Capsid assembly protein n=1 Tax=Pseudomonas mosselii TaxID=78327 RepID=A0ABX9AX77_9PSED|nr:phage capsid assembly protein [Pseudomonas mosselii]MCL8298404.1 hypothetical protein [Pseudomonas mosselii]MCL8338397.1 hypothetical protein [Pseudomonas mosselii]QZP24870.1 hypothetical protein K5H97_18790 [Pseudomonas mosselii]WJR26496.1 hypothetical protein LU678_019185 [Pseudomonas mosselii]